MIMYLCIGKISHLYNSRYKYTRPAAVILKEMTVRNNYKIACRPDQAIHPISFLIAYISFTSIGRITIMRALSRYRGYSSAGRALAWHARGQRFDPAYLHQKSLLKVKVPIV
jgi:hypothetical protein